MLPGLLLLAAYLCGSIPFGLIVARVVRGIDIRQHGSGNIGATNVWRVMGSRWGMFVLLLDLAKGLLPVWGGWQILAAWQASSAGEWQVGLGIATILGHMYPCWLGFRGGKGVATALGVVLVLAPVATLAAAAAFGLVFAISRIVSLGSIVAAVTFAVMQWTELVLSGQVSQHLAMATFSTLVPALIVLRHRSNIMKLWRGEEYRWRKPAAENPPTESR